MTGSLKEDNNSLKKILEMLFIPFKPLIEMTKDSQSMQIGLKIASVIIYIIPIVFYLATKNVLIALIAWLITIWSIKRICDDFSNRKSP